MVGQVAVVASGGRDLYEAGSYSRTRLPGSEKKSGKCSGFSSDMSSLRERLGGILVTAAILTGIAVINGYRLVSVILGVCVIAVGIAITQRRGSSRRRTASSYRQAGDRYTCSAEWSLRNQLDQAWMKEILVARGLRVSGDAGTLRLSRGSSLRTRLFGGYRVDPASLPMRGRMEVIETAGDGTRGGVRLHLEDGLGIALRDGRLGERYDRSFEEVVAMVRAASTRAS